MKLMNVQAALKKTIILHFLHTKQKNIPETSLSCLQFCLHCYAHCYIFYRTCFSLFNSLYFFPPFHQKNIISHSCWSHTKINSPTAGLFSISVRHNIRSRTFIEMCTPSLCVLLLLLLFVYTSISFYDHN